MSNIPWGLILVVGFLLFLILLSPKTWLLFASIVGAIFLLLWLWGKYIDIKKKREKERKKKEELDRQAEYIDDVLRRISVITVVDDVSKVEDSKETASHMRDAILWFYMAKTDAVIPARLIANAMINLSGQELLDEMVSIEREARDTFGEYAKTQSNNRK